MTNINYKAVKCGNVLRNRGVSLTHLGTKCSFDPYINCEVGCVYCNASIKLKTINKNEKGVSTIYIKVNSPEILARELSSLKRKITLNMGVITDPYQPAEEKYRVTRRILEVLNEHNCPFSIGTKSDLILRDLDLLKAASKRFHCCIAVSVTTLDGKLAKLLEPNASPPERRLEVVRKLSEAGVMVGVWFTPIFPYITDRYENIESVVKASKENGAKFILGGSLDMRAPRKIRGFLRKHFAQYLSIYAKLYKWGKGKPTYYPAESYLYNLYEKFIYACQKNGVKHYIPHFHTRQQALLFYLRNFSKFKGTPLFELTQIMNYAPISQGMLQTIQIKYGNNALGRGVLEAFQYFPH